MFAHHGPSIQRIRISQANIEAVIWIVVLQLVWARFITCADVNGKSPDKNYNPEKH
jgi:hypothetical protein